MLDVHCLIYHSLMTIPQKIHHIGFFRLVFQARSTSKVFSGDKNWKVAPLKSGMKMILGNMFKSVAQ